MRAGRAAAALLLLLAWPAAAQRGGCGFGEGLAALAAAERALRGAPELPSLSAGRALAAEAGERLRAGAGILAGCGCARAAEEAAEAALLAEQAGSEVELARLRATLDRARFSLSLARQRLDRTGCAP
ncbi:hypothetical protein [Crenalkalicoccus roseus]|uniref:hypothetical protein n=1 Tax=Crenalkalicoccus roseus TaxID=1485588 RepID=UPI001081663C|nr:hypothetical protein [Crenalkalicoccus roseus]